MVATGHVIGAGFDHAPLGTLFLAMPDAWRGTRAQDAGRLHREHAARCEVVSHDYVAVREPMLARMAEGRRAGYRRLG